MGWFLTSGTADGTHYAPGSVTGSANGSPRSAGYIGNFFWWPKQNIDLAVQYTGYARFNGGNTNYDGSGRNASDNNTTYLLARFVFCEEMSSGNASRSAFPRLAEPVSPSGKFSTSCGLTATSCQRQNSSIALKKENHR